MFQCQHCPQQDKAMQVLLSYYPCQRSLRTIHTVNHLRSHSYNRPCGKVPSIVSIVTICWPCLNCLFLVICLILSLQVLCKRNQIVLISYIKKIPNLPVQAKINPINNNTMLQLFIYFWPCRLIVLHIILTLHFWKKILKNVKFIVRSWTKTSCKLDLIAGEQT